MRATAVAVAVVVLAGCAWIEQVNVPIAGRDQIPGAENGWISANGRYAYFTQRATNLVPETLGQEPSATSGGVFRRDLRTGRTIVVRLGAGLTEDPGVARDHTRLLLYDFTNEHRFVLDRRTGSTQPAAVDSNEQALPGTTTSATLSADGRFVALKQWRASGGRSLDAATYVRDLDAGTTKLVATVPAGPDNFFIGRFPQPLSLSGDGSTLVQSTCTKSTGGGRGDTCTEWILQVVDLATGAVTTPFPNQPDPFGARLSENGRIIVYSNGTALRAYNREIGTTSLVAAVSTGWPSLSANGRFALFTSSAANVVPGITPPAGGYPYVYVRDRQRRVTTLVSADAGGAPITAEWLRPALSADGRYAVFNGFASATFEGTSVPLVRLYAKSAYHPHVSYATPNSGARGRTVTVDVIGYGFRPDAEVFVHREDTRLEITGVGVTEQLVRIGLRIPSGAPLGAYDITVHDPGGGPGPDTGAADTCEACFTVTAS